MKSSATIQRNDQAYKVLMDFFNNADEKQQFREPFNADEVETLFTTPIWGLREVVLTIIVGSLLDPKFKASEDFYACHPRSLYPGPIRKALREFRIPHRKDGALNIAKGIEKINLDWATNRRGDGIALSVVKIVEKIESVPSSELNQFAAAFISRYKDEAGRVKDMEVTLPPQENPLMLTTLCTNLIDEVPDGGATAQFIIGLLMDMQKNDRASKVGISGYMDSVSTTNTTSKKPGDIIELMENSGAELVYEVTTKEFSDNRLIESHESVMAYSRNIADVFVICRPIDVPASLEKTPQSYIMASTQHKELSYYFVNIYDYIQSSLLFTTPDARKSFFNRLEAYVNEINRSESVKLYFKEWHLKRDQSPSSSSAS